MKKLFFSMALAAILAGCTTEPMGEDYQSPQGDRGLNATPYELEFMQQIVAEVAGTRAASDLQPTHFYVEFAPTTAQQYNMLLGQTELACTPFSLFDTYDMPQDRNYFTPESINGPGKLYAVIENGQTLPDGVTYTVLKSYYAPGADKNLTDEDVAYRIALRAKELNDQNTATTRVSGDFVPRGTVKVLDASGKYVRVEGVPVFITSYTEGSVGLPISETCYTDNSGTFEATRDYFDHAVTYRIIWQNSNKWALKDAAGNQAVTNGPSNSRSRWDLQIMYALGLDNKPYFYANALRAIRISETNGLTIPGMPQLGPLEIICSDSPGEEDSRLSIPDQNTLPAQIYLNCGSKGPQKTIEALSYELGRVSLYHFDRTKYND